MGRTLTEQILDAHRASHASLGPPVGRVLGVDHVVLDRSAAAWTLAAFDALGPARVRPELVLACIDGGPARFAFESSPELTRIRSVAARCGVRFSRPGNGEPDLVYRNGYASPGKLVVAAGACARSSGALGALMLAGSLLETAAVLAGAPLHAEFGGVLGVWLEGSLGSWVSGRDLGLELHRRLPPRGARGRVVELSGPGVAALSMADRIAVAAMSEELAARAVIVPSDETTRSSLKAQRRDAEWKRLGPDPDAVYDERLEIDLHGIEPRLAPIEDLAASRLVRHAIGLKVRRVVLGSATTVGDLVRVAAALDGARVAEGTELVIVPPGRSVLDAAARLGLLDTLAAAGATWAEGGGQAGHGSAMERAESGLTFGAGRGELRGRRMTWFAASPETCAAAARVGRIMDPRELGAAFPRNPEPDLDAAVGAWVLEPKAAEELEAIGPDDSAPRFPFAPSLGGPLRGVVLAKLGDHVGTGAFAARGARLAALGEDVATLAAHTLEGLDPGFVARARAHAGGFVVGGLDLGSGDGQTAVAAALMSLGVRVALARSFDPGFQRILVQVGVLPLRLRLDNDYRVVLEGDELEIPGLPEALEPAKPVVVRDLTQGLQLTLQHDLAVRDITMLRAGGLLPLTLLETPGLAPRGPAGAPLAAGGRA